MKKKVKYKRKAKKNGKPRMEPKLRRFLIFITIFLIILAALILILVVKPAFLEDVFNKNQDSQINVGGTAPSKTVNTPSVPSPNTNGGSTPKPPAAAPSSGGTNDFPDYSAYYSRLPGVLTQTPMVQDVPKGETILLRFYNFNTGVREFEKSYLLTKSNAKEGYLDNPEITIVVHSKYVPEINSNNLCETITKAGNNNDVGIYTDLSATKLILKFKSMMEYKDCLM